MQVHAAIAQALSDHGIGTLFGLVGDGNLFIASSFVDNNSGRYVAAASEGGAVLMANGYASVRGRLGAATVTHGPGLTNTFTALVEGARSRTPVLVIAGDTQAGAQHLQDIGQRDVVAPTGAGFEQVSSPQSVVDAVAVAARRAVDERRPVVLNVPVEFQWEDVPYHGVDAASHPMETDMPDEASLDAAVGMIATAKRPLILAGRGAANTVARTALLRLADRIGSPVTTTLKSKDLFRDENCDLGVFGTLSHSATIKIIMESDCVIAFGASLNQRTTDFGDLLENKRLVQCDIERSNIGKYVRVDAPIVGDSATVADTIIQWLDAADVGKPSTHLTGLKGGTFAEDPAGGSTSHPGTAVVDIRTASHSIEKCVPRDRTVVADVGRFLTEALKHIHVPSPDAYVHTVNFGSIGLGMGNAVGAAMAVPDRPVLLLSGDGGFMLGGLGEFNTAVRYGADIISVIFDDGAYGAEHVQYRNRGVDPSISMCDWPDFASLATALGGSGATVRCIDDLDHLPEVVARRRGPLLIDVKLDPDTVPNHRRH